MRSHSHDKVIWIKRNPAAHKNWIHVMIRPKKFFLGYNNWILSWICSDDWIKLNYLNSIPSIKSVQIFIVVCDFNLSNKVKLPHRSSISHLEGFYCSIIVLIKLQLYYCDSSKLISNIKPIKILRNKNKSQNICRWIKLTQ